MPAQRLTDARPSTSFEVLCIVWLASAQSNRKPPFSMKPCVSNAPCQGGDESVNNRGLPVAYLLLRIIARQAHPNSLPNRYGCANH